MTITNGYATAAELKARLDIADYEDDSQLESVIEAVSRWIDTNRNRRIYAAAETRYYTATERDYIIVDDLLSVTTLSTDDNADDSYETTWTASDFLLMPFNAPSQNRPYTSINISHATKYSFPANVFKGVKIIGSFGYAAATPKPIKEACILASMRVFKRKDILFGTQGSAELGTVSAIASILRDGELNYILDAVPRRVTYG